VSHFVTKTKDPTKQEFSLARLAGELPGAVLKILGLVWATTVDSS
jgi:hypothetical protein